MTARPFGSDDPQVRLTRRGEAVVTLGQAVAVVGLLWACAVLLWLVAP